jgi:invasion protein IalB
MDRWILSVVVAGTFLLAGFGAHIFPGLDTLSAAAAENQPEGQFAQLVSPPSSTERRSTTAPTAPPSAQSAPAPAAQTAPAPSTPGAAKPPAPAKGPGWAVNCKSTAKEKELECRMSQTVVVKQTGKVLTNVTFRIPADTKKPEIIVQLPLGLNLQAGATFQVDENTPQRLGFRACDRKGCYASSPVSPEVLATLRRGKQLKIGFQNLAEKPITVPLVLDGFGDAYDKMQKPA